MHFFVQKCKQRISDEWGAYYGMSRLSLLCFISLSYFQNQKVSQIFEIRKFLTFLSRKSFTNEEAGPILAGSTLGQQTTLFCPLDAQLLPLMHIIGFQSESQVFQLGCHLRLRAWPRTTVKPVTVSSWTKASQIWLQ